ncbi:MAG: SLC13 family permease [Candidatus Jordarchaeaceae archaeon]
MFGLEYIEGSFIPEWATYFLQSQLPPAQIIFTTITLVTFGLIATKRLHRTVAALGGAVATLIAGGYFSYVYSWVPFFTYFTSLYYQVEMGLPLITPVWQPLLFSFTDVYKEFVNWSTILIIISVVIITSVARRSGLFEYLIIKVAKFSGGNIKRLFIYIWVLTFVLTMLLGNNPTFIIVSVLVFQIARVLDLDPVPYILGTMFVVNAGSSSTVIGGFVNILVSGYYNLDPSRWLSYPTFIVLGLPIALVCMIVSLFFIFHYYRDAFQIPMERTDQLDVRYRLLSFDERILVRNPKIFRRLAALLAATIAGFIVAGFVGVPFYVIALIFAFAFLFVSGENPERTLREVNWSLVFFFIGIFIVVGGVNSTHALGNLGNSLGTLTSTNVPGTISLVALFCGVLSGVLYNISVATAMIYVTPSLSMSALINQNIVIWSLLYGANLGSNLTPLGGTPNLIAITSLEREGYHVSWRSFLKIGVPITFVSLFAGIILLTVFAHLLGWGVTYTDLVVSLVYGALRY